MAATAVTLNDLEGHSPVAGLFKCNPSNSCVAFYTIATDSVLARSLCISRASCNHYRSFSVSSFIKCFLKYLRPVNTRRDILMPLPPLKRVCSSVSECVSWWLNEWASESQNIVNTISQKPVRRISSNFGQRCVGFVDVLIRFWGQKVKRSEVKVTADGGITVDDSPSSSI